MSNQYLLKGHFLQKIFLFLLSLQLSYDLIFELLINNSNIHFTNYYQIAIFILSNYLSLFIVTTFIISIIFMKLSSYFKIHKTKILHINILSYFFSICFILGRNYDNNFAINELINYLPFIILNIYLLKTILYSILCILEDGFQNRNRNYKLNLRFKKYYEYFLRHIFIFSFLIFIILGIPYFYFYYPGPVQWDGLAQLNQYFGIKFWDNHYPAISTIIMGNIFKLGKTLIDDNFGIFLFTITQSILSAIILAYTVKFISSINSSFRFIAFSLIFYSILPFWPLNSYTFIKDTYYYLFFLLLFIQFIKVVILNDKRIINYILILIFCLIIWIFRNDGYYIILLSLIGLIIHKLSIKNILYSISILIVIISVNSFYHINFLPNNNILEGSIREMLSVPIQQTARFCKEAPELISLKDDTVIYSAFNLNCKDLGSKYNPESSDNVKMYFRYNPTKDDLKDYFDTWLSLLKKDPVIYFDAFLNNYYGYFYPLKHEYKDGITWNTIQYSELVYTGDFNLYMLDHRKYGRDIIENVTLLIRNLPIIEFIFNVGTYTWILIFYLVVSIRLKKFDYLIASAPLCITLLICFVSPVNAYIRYMLPIIVSTPLILSILKLNIENI